MTQPVYLHDWSDSKLNGLMEDFRISESDLEGIHILLASYTYEDYSGSAFVLYEKAGNLYEVNGSHCSCYGLEDQWDPEETTLEVLKFRLRQGQLGRAYDRSEYDEELSQVLERWEAER